MRVRQVTAVGSARNRGRLLRFGAAGWTGGGPAGSELGKNDFVLVRPKAHVLDNGPTLIIAIPLPTRTARLRLAWISHRVVDIRPFPFT